MTSVSSWELLSFNARLGTAPFLGGLPYFRWIEYPIALELAGEMDGHSIVDIGSGRRGRFPLFLMTRLTNARVHSTDIIDYSSNQQALANRLGLGEGTESKLVVEREDATQLSYPDATFDTVFAISTLEHIPNEGDSLAMMEISRVLKPTGKAIISVPINLKGYEEIYRKTDVSFQRHSSPVFYERHYDLATFEERLEKPSGLELKGRVLFGERGFRFWDRVLQRILILPMYLQWISLPFRLAGPLWARLFLTRLESSELGAVEGGVFLMEHPR